MIKGIIVKGIGGFYYVKAEDKNVYECKARGVFRKEKITPTIGDRVEIDVKNNKGSIVKIEERTNCLVRPSVANIDTIFIVVAATSPEPNLFLIDKMLINAHINNIEPVICINKTDLADREDISKIYSDIGYKIIKTSAINGNECVNSLMPYLKGKVTAFAGTSGVGKSSLLSNVTDFALQTGSISEKIGRGKHTTRHVELFEIDENSYVLDTPGFGSLETEDTTAEELSTYFPEMKNKSSMCRFRGCSHINEPDCAVKEMLNSGEMVMSRYESYKEIYTQLKNKKQW